MRTPEEIAEEIASEIHHSDMAPGPIGTTVNFIGKTADRIAQAIRDARADGMEEAAKIVDVECPNCDGTKVVEIVRPEHDPKCDGSCHPGCPVPVQDQEPCNCGIHRLADAIRATAAQAVRESK